MRVICHAGRMRTGLVNINILHKKIHDSADCAAIATVQLCIGLEDRANRAFLSFYERAPLRERRTVRKHTYDKRTTI